MSQEVLFEEVVTAAGGLTALANAVGESLQTVTNWRKRRFPVAQCKAIEAASGVSVKRLRADWATYWPDADGVHATSSAVETA